MNDDRCELRSREFVDKRDHDFGLLDSVVTLKWGRTGALLILGCMAFFPLHFYS